MSQPAHKIKIGRIAATIWNNDSFYSVDVSRAYKDNQGEWKSTNSFSQSDLLNLAKCAERAEAWINHTSNSTTQTTSRASPGPKTKAAPPKAEPA